MNLPKSNCKLKILDLNSWDLGSGYPSGMGFMLSLHKHRKTMQQSLIILFDFCSVVINLVFFDTKQWSTTLETTSTKISLIISLGLSLFSAGSEILKKFIKSKPFFLSVDQKEQISSKKKTTKMLPCPIFSGSNQAKVRAFQRDS